MVKVVTKFIKQLKKQEKIRMQCLQALELAEFIKKGDPIKPVRLIKSDTNRSKYSYELIEGRLRYWAWVLAYEGEKDIPALIRSI